MPVGQPPKSPKSPLPSVLAPQLATLVSEAPDGVEWLHELKLDRFRVLCRVDGGAATLLTRSGQDWQAYEASRRSLAGRRT